MSALYYDVAVFNAYSPDYSSYCTKVIVVDVSHHFDELNTNRGDSGVCSSLLCIEPSDWNLFFSFDKIKLDNIENALKMDIFHGMSDGVCFVLFFVEDSESAKVVSDFCINNKFQRCILVYCVENDNKYVLNLDVCSDSDLSRMFYCEGTTIKEKMYIVDSLAHAFLKQSLVCVDIADLFSVLRGNMCCATFLHASYSKSNFVINDFLENNESLLKRSSGVFVCFMYSKFINVSIDDIDVLANSILGKLNEDAMLYFSVDYQRELDFEFGCALFVEVL